MTRTHKIFLVEDNAADVALLRQFFPTSELHCQFSVAMNGEEASNFIHKRGSYTQREIPDLFILDLNLPRKNGKEILSEIKACPDLHAVPVLMLSGSDNSAEKRACLELGASRFLVKPSNLDALGDIFSVITQYLKAGSDFDPLREALE
jgi:two-component system, chemotaxis family, response regulator Rcp1